MNIINEIRSVFKLPSALALAERELHKAQLELLVSQTALEFSEAIVAFNQRRIRRLCAIVADAS